MHAWNAPLMSRSTGAIHRHTYAHSISHPLSHIHAHKHVCMYAPTARVEEHGGDAEEGQGGRAGFLAPALLVIRVVAFLGSELSKGRGRVIGLAITSRCFMKMQRSKVKGGRRR